MRRTAQTAASRSRAGAARRAPRHALDAARQAVIAMRASDEIGDDAFHQVEEQLDWMEMAGGRGAEVDDAER